MKTVSVATLPDPKPSELELGDKVLVQRQGTGATTLDLTGLVGNAKDVTVRWTCLGAGAVQLEDGAPSNVLVGGGCADSPAELTFTGGEVLVSKVSSLKWTLSAEKATEWRIVVYTQN